jgi:hypothetical protein
VTLVSAWWPLSKPQAAAARLGNGEFAIARKIVCIAGCGQSLTLPPAKITSCWNTILEIDP